MQKHAVQNHTAIMMEIGTNLLNQTAEQTRKLTDVEAQVKYTGHKLFSDKLSFVLGANTMLLLTVMRKQTHFPYMSNSRKNVLPNQVM